MNLKNQNSKFKIAYSAEAAASAAKAGQNSKFWSFFGVCFLVLGISVALPALAQVNAGLEQLEGTGLGTTDIRITVANIIRVFLGLIGTVGVVLVLYGGFLWMTAAGNEERIDKAKKVLMNAAIGLAIVLLSYAIVSFVVSRFLAATGGGGDGGDGSGGPGNGTRGALGGGIVESHYPARDATGIVRNTKIIITFKESILRSSLVDDRGTPDDATDDLLNATNVKLRKTIADSPQPSDFLTNLRAASTPDGKTFVFAPQTLLGSPSEEISYTIRFDSGVKKANGQDAFGQFGDHYEWQFGVSTQVDTTPPKVESVLPLQDALEPRNVVVQVNFDEAVDPTVVAGDIQQSKVRVTDAQGTRIQGTVRIANQYKTIEFVTNLLCGKNSCGGDVFCLPENATIAVLLPTADPAQTTGLPNGIVDIAGNPLDGDKDGTAEGSPTDDVSWSFTTTDAIDLEPPRVEVTSPVQNAGLVAQDAPITALFSKPLMSSTFNAATVSLTPAINYWAETTLEGRKTKGIVKHDNFAPNTAYYPVLSADIKDLYQNCYFPCSGPGCTGKSWTGYPSCSF